MKKIKITLEVNTSEAMRLRNWYRRNYPKSQTLKVIDQALHEQLEPQLDEAIKRLEEHLEDD